MILIGMFDSPFVRRVAISMDLLDLPFEHRDWSVGADFAKIREYHPLGRVPVLVLDNNDVVVESAMILDYLDDRVGPARALVPPQGEPRRRALYIVALAIGAVEKGLAITGERVFRPLDKRHPPWLERCQLQVTSALAALEDICSAARHREWLIGDRIGQADITLGCVASYLQEAAGVDLSPHPLLAARCAHYDQAAPFRARYRAFTAPVPH